MTFHPAAFRVGEYAKLASAETIRMFRTRYADNAWLYCESSMDQYADKLVRVIQNALPIHGVAYRLEEVLLKKQRRASIPGICSEEAFVDGEISTEPESEPYRQLVSEVCTASADNDDGVGIVSIYDRDRRLVSCFRNIYAKDAADSVNRIARLRC